MRLRSHIMVVFVIPCTDRYSYYCCMHLVLLRTNAPTGRVDRH